MKTNSSKSDPLPSSNLIDRALHSANIGTWDWNINTNETVFNDAFYTMLGYEPGELPMTLESWTNLVHPEDLDAALFDINNHLESKTPKYLNEHRLKKKDGSWCWIRDTGTIVEHNPDGTPKRMMGVHIDIDSNHRMSLALKSITQIQVGEHDQSTLEQLCKELAGFYGVAFVGIGKQFEESGVSKAQILSGWHNNHPAQVFNYNLEGTPCDVALRDSFYHIESGVIEEFPDDKLLVDFQAQGYAGIRLFDSKGNGIGLLIMLHTGPFAGQDELESTMKMFGTRASFELERLENEQLLRIAKNEAVKSDLAKSEFLANMSHEIRTPMTAILGYSNLIENDHDSSPEQAMESIKRIQSNANHLLTIINDILDVSKIGAGQMAVEIIDTNPSQIIESVASLVSQRAQEKGIKIHTHYSSPFPTTIQSDSTRLRQILLNLVGNAVKFTQRGSVEIHARCDLDAQQLEFRITDTGIGMSPEQRDVVAQFDAFSQADSSTTRKFGGSGLGLRISNSLSELLGSRIEIESEQGKGSVFSFRIHTGKLDRINLIADDAIQSNLKNIQTESATSISTPHNKPLYGTRILIAEDGIDNQRLLSFHLKKAGATISFFENGLLAAQHIESCKPNVLPNVILMDMQMPELDGYDATKRLRNFGINLPIIALTAHAMADDRQKCIDVGCDDYLTKPIDFANLIDRCVYWHQQPENTSAA